MALPVRIGVVRGLLKEVSTAAKDTRPIAVGGVLAEVLRRELVRGGRANAVRVGPPEGAAVYVHVVGGEGDEEALKRAHRAHVPLVAVAEGGGPGPYVLATDVVPLEPGKGFPVETIARVIARKLGEDGTALAAGLPVLRGPVCDYLIASFARKNAVVAAAVWIPGADLPVLTLNQLRLVLRIAAAYGEEVDRERLLEIVAALGAGIGFRALARELLDLLPVAGWAVKGAVAYAGTRALGEAAVQWFEARRPAGDDAPRRRPGAASPAAP
jgi:uncharacterized protein (DUF697 family)